jgi:3-oxoacyl-[acyl-carrier-protein] synthase II
MNNQNNRRVVVTGLGAVSPIGLEVNTMWESMLAGRNGINDISTFDTSNFQVKKAAEIRGFDIQTYVNRKQARHMDRFTQFAVASALQAVEAANLRVTDENKDEIGIIIGNSVCGLLSVTEQQQILTEQGPDRVSPVLAPTMSGDAASVQISLLLGTRGLNFSTSSACASGADAIGQSYNLIKQGYTKCMIAGGCESPLMPLVIAAFTSIHALSKNGACRPFDLNRDGFIMGEGGAVLILEDYEFAVNRGAPVLAEMVSYGASSDAFHLVQPSPDGDGAIKAVDMAFRLSGINPEEIDYIHAHGTSTLLNDRVETRVVKQTFGGCAKKVPVSATKSMTGHLLGGSGSLGAVVALLAMQHQMVPPTINLDTPDPECDLDYVPNKARKAKIKTTMANSFGFGGHNAVLIFRQAS